MNQEKFQGSVKVMRSYDYCHFEVQLSSSDEKTIEQINDMRKDAARLVDKAVNQYGQWKRFHEWIGRDEYELRRLIESVDSIRKESESEWTPEQKAKVKLLNDVHFHRAREYNYRDDWKENYPWY